MSKQKKSMLVLAMITAFVATAVFVPGPIGAGNLEPPGPPTTGTMHTLDEIYSKLEAIENKLVILGSGGRFSDLEDGTVRDNVTGLIWLKDANCLGQMNWGDAMAAADTLEEPQCGLTDGSVAGDWRLPTKEEWEEFVDTRYTSPALCNASGMSQWSEGDAFNNVQSGGYWSSTTDENNTGNAWAVYMDSGGVGSTNKPYYGYVWPVRAGN
jgi:hypothetical protein